MCEFSLRVILIYFSRFSPSSLYYISNSSFDNNYLVLICHRNNMVITVCASPDVSAAQWAAGRANLVQEY